MFRQIAQRTLRTSTYTARQMRPAFSRSIHVASKVNNGTSSRRNAALFAGFLVVSTGATMIHAKENNVDLEKVKEDIAELIEKDNYIGPTFVRLAWHSSGTYSKHDGSGGSKGGTIRFSPEVKHGANAGLHLAIEKLESIKKKYPEISYADLYV